MNWKQINNSPVVGAIASIFFLVIGLGLYFVVNKIDSENSPDKIVKLSSPLTVGQVGILNGNKDKKHCIGIVVVAQTKEAFDEFSISSDESRIQELIRRGNVFSAPNCSKVRVIDTDSKLSLVRFLEPENENIIGGWVAYEFAVSN
ncbi:MAG: hypothetical protein A2240_00875 [Candidatus Jacksonbacteria bacterium RIFOXYA2_FULL_43_12]|nr:MAG: hypothetical protein A2240_00875 [Candidatus Jacksonbacteria bacterium RIFOXYA2_FULL_43_12]HCC50174.1 hypothetical protein [Candidatus Jacksonbacteria bacterium]